MLVDSGSWIKKNCFLVTVSVIIGQMALSSLTLHLAYEKYQRKDLKNND
jgi:hypothetical protein